MKKIIVLIALLCTGCSVVQWLPTSACDYVKYERIGNDVTVDAKCEV